MSANKITAIEAQKRNSERVNIFLNGEFAFGLNELDAARLQVGQVLSDADIQRLKANDAATEAFNRAVRFLAPRPRSSTEIRRHLRQKDIEDSLIDEALERLERLNYVNDLEFAQFWVRNRNQFKPRGARALRYELREKGIDNSIIDEVLSELDPLSLARSAAESKMRSLRGKDEQTVRNKLGGYLTRRGFDYETVRTVIDEVLDEANDVDF